MATTRIPLTQPLCLLYYATGATRKIPHRGLDQPTLLLSPRLSSNCRQQSLDLLSGPYSSPRFPLTYAEEGREPDGDGDDIAVCDFDADDLEPYKFSYVTPARFLTKETMSSTI
jgi:hypothetical protein